MKFIKGCLVTIIIFIGFCVIGYFLFKNNVTNNLENLNNNVEQNWNKYIENLKERNIELSLQNFKNDSLKFYWTKSKSIPFTEYSDGFEFNEYKINQFTMSDSLSSNSNNKINLTLENYNQAVREYNTYRITFPNSLIARKLPFRKFYDYFDVRYGVDNEKTMIRKKKREEWVKNGGPLPE